MKQCQGRITVNIANGYGGDTIDVYVLNSDGWYKLFLNKLMEGKISLDAVKTLWPIVYGYEGTKLKVETDTFKIDLKPIEAR